MVKNFSKEEKALQKCINKFETFKESKIEYSVIDFGKPTCPKGEPKTDLYICAKNKTTSTIKEFKISYKKDNADFLENKIQAERARQILGKDWDKIIYKSTKQIKNKFKNKKLIYKKQQGHTKKGSFTLGWKFELVNKPNGELSGQILLDESQLADIYSGQNLNIEKKNSYVNNRIVKDSGVANYMLISSSNINNLQDIIDNLISIDNYIKNNPKIYFACKALNYRSFENKYDGNRPLAVYVKWFIENNKLKSKLIFNQPLKKKGNDIANELKHALNSLQIRNTDNVNSNNVYSYEIINDFDS